MTQPPDDLSTSPTPDGPRPAATPGGPALGSAPATGAIFVTPTAHARGDVVDTGTYQLAGWGRRAGAYVIDALIAFVIFVVVAGALGFLAASLAPDGFLEGPEPTDDEAGAVFLVVVLVYVVAQVVALLPRILLMPRWSGATPGKRAVGIRVVRTDGRRVTLGLAVGRELGCKWFLFTFIGGNACFIPLLLNYLWPLWDDRKRALHDMMVKTQVVLAEPRDAAPPLPGGLPSA